MAFDSTIRVRQINQTELSGFVVGVVPSSSYLLSGNITPSGSGVYNLGSSTNYYKNVYSNAVTLPSGSGIQIGSSFLTAYSSGGAGVVQIDGYKITSSGNFISIQGPQGIQGPTGATGITGPTGTSVTVAYYNSSNYQLTLYFNNSTSSVLDIPPLTGATGVSLTGFYQSGSYIYPQFDNYQPLGAPVQLIAGPQGPPGSINLYFNSGSSVPSYPDVNFPSGVTVDSYYVGTINPPISLMRGMAYTIDASGLGTHRITQSDINILTGLFFTGQAVPFSVGDYLNYYTDPTNGTGYWRMVFFPNATTTGYYDTFTSPTLFSNIETINSDIYYDTLQNSAARTKISFTTNFTALSNYKYGFALYSLGGDTALDYLVTYPTGYAIVCGDVNVSSGIGPIGPVGPSGAQGPSGLQGPSGATGIGVGIYSSQYQQVGTNAYQLRFLKTDGNYTSWVPLPSGGPSGVDGPQGPPGSLTNYFSGEFNPALDYGVNSTISYIGSTYINTGPSALGIYPPSVPWQLLAKSGAIGATGASGVADRYSSSFYVVSGFPTGTGTYANNITGITVNGSGLSGTGARFQTGQIVSFRNSGLIGYSYTPYQNIVVASNTYTGTYCWGQVNSYNSTSGILSFTVQSGGTGITGTSNPTLSGNYFLWYNYGNSTINLGANLMTGAPGPVGPQGPVGPSGQPSLLRYTSDYILNFNGNYDSVLLQPSGLDIFNLIVTGQFNAGAHQPIINFDFSNFYTGKSIIMKVRNSGVNYSDIADPPLFSFTGNATGIRWPSDQYSFPNNGYVYIYTIIRFPDDNGITGLFGTYSNPYTYNR